MEELVILWLTLLQRQQIVKWETGGIAISGDLSGVLDVWLSNWDKVKLYGLVLDNTKAQGASW